MVTIPMMTILITTTVGREFFISPWVVREDSLAAAAAVRRGGAVTSKVKFSWTATVVGASKVAAAEGRRRS